MVFEIRRLAGDRPGAVHGVQTVRRRMARQQLSAIRIPRGGPARRIKSRVIQEGQGGSEIIATTTDDRRVASPPPTWTVAWWVTCATTASSSTSSRARKASLCEHAGQLGPDAAADRRLDLLHAPDAGRRQGRAFSFGKSRPACSTRTTTPSPLPTWPAATRPRKRSRNWWTS